MLANGVFTAWSGGTNPLPPARTYKVMGLANDSGVPPTSPPDDANQALTDVVLDWEPIKGAKSYELQISTDELSRRPPSSTSRPIVYGTRYSPPKTLNNDQYFWRVRASDAAGFQPTGPAARSGTSSGPGRTSRRFSTRRTTRRTSRPRSTTSGRRSSAPARYVVQISPVAPGSPRRRRSRSSARRCTRRSCTATTPATAGRPRRHLQLAGHGQGRVLQRDAGHRRDRRPGRDVHLQAAAGHDDRAAQRQRLANAYDPNQSLGAPVLTWNPVAGADKYKVTIQGTTTQSFTTAALSYAPRYLAPGTYSWDVQTVDALGAIGAGHATGQRTFTVKQPPMVEDLGPPRTVHPDARARPPAGGQPADTRPARPWLVVPVPVAHLEPGQLGRPLRGLRGAQRATLHQGLRETSSWAAGDDTRHHPPQPRELRVVRQGDPQGRRRPSPEAPAPSRSCRCRTSRSSPTRPP